MLCQSNQVHFCIQASLNHPLQLEDQQGHLTALERKGSGAQGVGETARKQQERGVQIAAQRQIENAFRGCSRLEVTRLEVRGSTSDEA